MKRGIITVIVILSIIGMVRWYNRPDNGIHNIGKNVVLIEGECVMINWDASEDEAYKALEAWVSMRAEK